jgi:hypothetical protein
VISPSSKTHPTEISFALWTWYMVASLIFLNWFLAFWTWLRIRQNPIYIFTFSRIFQLPLLSCITITRLMRLKATFKAEGGSTRTLDIPQSKIRKLNTRITAWLRTPSDHLIIIRESFIMKFMIVLQIISSHKFFK